MVAVRAVSFAAEVLINASVPAMCAIKTTTVPTDLMKQAVQVHTVVNVDSTLSVAITTGKVFVQQWN